MGMPAFDFNELSVAVGDGNPRHERGAGVFVNDTSFKGGCRGELS
jgi:hypothetical protein